MFMDQICRTSWTKYRTYFSDQMDQNVQHLCPRGHKFPIKYQPMSGKPSPIDMSGPILNQIEYEMLIKIEEATGLLKGF